MLLNKSLVVCAKKMSTCNCRREAKVVGGSRWQSRGLQLSMDQHWGGCVCWKSDRCSLRSSVLCLGSLRFPGNARARFAWDPWTRLRQGWPATADRDTSSQCASCSHETQLQGWPRSLKMARIAVVRGGRSCRRIFVTAALKDWEENAKRCVRLNSCFIGN